MMMMVVIMMVLMVGITYIYIYTYIINVDTKDVYHNGDDDNGGRRCNAHLSMNIQINLMCTYLHKYMNRHMYVKNV
jgi:hypothetical protein